jgi:toxin ParE1/3/4
MKDLSFTPRAEADIDAIWEYSFTNWGLDQAVRYTPEIRDICDALASGRKRGRAKTVRRGYLSCPCGSHVIWYRDGGDRLEIIRVLHSAQDVERQLHD